MSKICPHCQEYARIKRGVKKGYQEYRCKACGKCSSDSPRSKYYLEPKTQCRHCGSLSTRKIGFTNTTRYQRWKCNDCEKCFTDSPFPKGGLPIGEQPKPKSIRDMEYRKKLKSGELN